MLRGRHLDQLLRRTLGYAAHVKMVSHQQQERLRLNKITRAQDGMPISKRPMLFNKLETSSVFPCGSLIRGLVARTNHDANFMNTCRLQFLNQNTQSRFGRPIAVHKGLERQIALGLPRGSDYGLFDFHTSMLVFESAAKLAECARRVKDLNGTRLCRPRPAAEINEKEFRFG